MNLFDWKVYRLELERRAIEQAKRQKLRRQVVEAGYRTLAVKMHPDAGGSAESMVRLSEVRDDLLGKKPRPRARHTWTFEWTK
jgi:hypothetical protein